jgi:hypothetical protein
MISYAELLDAIRLPKMKELAPDKSIYSYAHSASDEPTLAEKYLHLRTSSDCLLPAICGNTIREN